VRVACFSPPVRTVQHYELQEIESSGIPYRTELKQMEHAGTMHQQSFAVFRPTVAAGKLHSSGDTKIVAHIQIRRFKTLLTKASYKTLS
jgi:hypothetical protein